MQSILIIGAGRSSSSMIAYLLRNAGKNNWKVTVGDMSMELVLQKTKAYPDARAIVLDVKDEQQRQKEIQNADLIISMLPASMHMDVARECVKYKKHLVTASYVSPEMRELDEEAKKADIILLNEIGLDPGLDHASAMRVIDSIYEKGGELDSFRSYCGGLVAPEFNDNPWGYKFSWNPRNVVLAGQGTAQFMEDGIYKYIPYNRLFLQTEIIEVEGNGSYEAYANRDSLSYRKYYDIEKIPTMLRGTLRMPGYCRAWNVFVKLGLTDDSYKIEASEKLSWKELLESFLPKGSGTIRERLKEFMGKDAEEESLAKLDWLDIYGDRPLHVANASPAQILQHLLEEKWKLGEDDKDMIVMQHEFEYRNNQERKKLTSSLVVKGEDKIYTAMAKTVGLPLAIAAKLILQNRIKGRGVLIPVSKEIYEPVLEELEEFGIIFKEKEEIQKAR